jgi:hypothetical protein
LFRAPQPTLNKDLGKLPRVVALRSYKMLVFLRGAEIQVSVKIEVVRLRAGYTCPELPVPDASDFL